MRILKLHACPACGGESFLFFDLGDENVLRRCQSCDTVSAREYADPDEVFVDGYLLGGAGKFGIDVRHPTFQAYLANVAQRRLSMIESATGLKSASLLDVGCGTGEVLAGARDRGWTVVGVEPEASGAGIASERGLEVHNSLLEDSGLPRSSYDVVSLFHVLEHVPDSLALLRSVKRWVRPGGFLAVEVPNFASVQRRRRGCHWRHLRPLEHLVHFEPATLAATLLKAGVEPLAVRSPEYLEPPSSMDDLLDTIGRENRFRRLMSIFSRVESREGETPVRYPTAAGWRILRAVEAVHDRAGAGSVVFSVSQVP